MTRLIYIWTDGSTFIPVNSVLLSSENRKSRINDAASVDKRSAGYKRRQLSMEKGIYGILRKRRCIFASDKAHIHAPVGKYQRINDAASVDKRSAGYKRRQLSMEKGTTAMRELLKAKK